MAQVSARFVDICTSDYVLDHCNGDNECLIGVSLSADMTSADILESALLESFHMEKIPAEVSDDMLKAELGPICMQIGQALAGMVACGECDNLNEDSDAPYADIEALAWIRLTWSAIEQGV